MIIKDAPKLSSKNRFELDVDADHGCYHCIRVFKGSEITEFVEMLLGMHRVNTVDNRGYYIAHSDGNCGGVHYLYSDGIIRDDVNGCSPVEANAFWPTEKDAWGFYFKWAVAQGKNNG